MLLNNVETDLKTRLEKEGITQKELAGQIGVSLPYVNRITKGREQLAVILPGVHIGDGAIIGANSIVGNDVDPYTIVVGNPAKPLRKRFDDELIGLLLKFKWWDKSVEEINSLIPILTCSELEKVRKEIEARL